MTKVYLSYGYQSKALASELKIMLTELEYEAIDPQDEISPGNDISKSIESLIKQSDVVIQIFDEKQLGSQWFDREVDLAQALGKFVIPITQGTDETPKGFDGYYILRADRTEPSEMIRLIDKAITNQRVHTEEIETEKKEVKDRVERNISQYIESSLIDLKEREKSYKNAAKFWYSLGYLVLFVGVGSGFYKAYYLDTVTANLSGLIQLTILSLVLLGLLVGLSKYAFTLGKSYMVESLRNADRSHAISFGEFFIKAFPDDLEWEKIKEVFQHWNIDKGSAFSEQTCENFDPKVLQTAVEIAKTLNSKSSKAK